MSMSTGFSRVELDYCKKVTEKLYNHPLALGFLRPVNPQLDGAPDYFQKISQPMDLGTIKNNLENNNYSNSKAWATDINLVWSNAMRYNPKKNILYHIAEKLNQKCSKLLKNIPKNELDLWSIKLAKVNQKLKRRLNDPASEETTVPRHPELAIYNENLDNLNQTPEKSAPESNLPAEDHENNNHPNEGTNETQNS